MRIRTQSVGKRQRKNLGKYFNINQFQSYIVAALDGRIRQIQSRRDDWPENVVNAFTMEQQSAVLELSLLVNWMRLPLFSKTPAFVNENSFNYLILIIESTVIAHNRLMKYRPSAEIAATSSSDIFISSFRSKIPKTNSCRLLSCAFARHLHPISWILLLSAWLMGNIATAWAGRYFDSFPSGVTLIQSLSDLAPLLYLFDLSSLISNRYHLN